MLVSDSLTAGGARPVMHPSLISQNQFLPTRRRTAHTRTHQLKISCFKIARRADTSRLIISPLKHLDGDCVCVRAMKSMHLQIHRANECESGTSGTPTAARIQGLMNLSEGK